MAGLGLFSAGVVVVFLPKAPSNPTLGVLSAGVVSAVVGVVVVFFPNAPNVPPPPPAAFFAFSLFIHLLPSILAVTVAFMVGFAIADLNTSLSSLLTASLMDWRTLLAFSMTTSGSASFVCSWKCRLWEM